MRIIYLILFSTICYSLPAQIPITLKPGIQTIDISEAKILFNWGVAQNLDFLMILDLLILRSVEIKSRIVIPKTVLNALLSTYNFDKWGNLQQFIPIKNISRIEMGAPIKEGQNALDLYQEQTYSGKSILGEFSLDQHFGFHSHAKGRFYDAFGVSAKQFFTSWPLEHMELYEPLKFSLWIKGFFKPKKYDIHPLIFN